MRKPLANLILICSTLLAGHGITAVAESGSPSADSEPVKIAIILDDLGYNRVTGERALELPGPVSYAVIPFTPYGSTLANEAHARSRDILLHMPMESADPGRRLDDGGLTMDQSEQEIRRRIDKAIRAVPYAVGMNNHMGSQITTDPLIMSWVMDEVRNKTPYFFVDSMTNARSVAKETALSYRIPSVRRDVFLDNTPEYAAIDKAFQRLIRIARHSGHAVAIGHPHSATLAYLEQKIPQLQAMGIELVPISQLTEEYGRPIDKPIRLQDLTRWIVAMPAPSSERLNFTN